MNFKSISICGALLAVVGTLAGFSLNLRTETLPHRAQAPRLNVCVLLDLSDRIAPEKNPLQADKDKKIIAAIANQFEQTVRKQLYVNSRDSLRVVVAPQANDYRETLAKTADAMTIDLDALKVTDKRDRLPLLKAGLIKEAETLYREAMNAPSFAGSDIWSFFRDDLPSYRMAGGGSSRNVLIVLTDGYIDFSGNRGRPHEGNRTSWMQVARFRQAGWEKAFDREDCGLIAPRTDLGDWEVLVLEVVPKTPRDLPVIRKYWQKWLTEMGISQYRIEPGRDGVGLASGIVADFLGSPPAVSTQRGKL